MYVRLGSPHVYFYLLVKEARISCPHSFHSTTHDSGHSSFGNVLSTNQARTTPCGYPPQPHRHLSHIPSSTTRGAARTYIHQRPPPKQCYGTRLQYRSSAACRAALAKVSTLRLHTNGRTGKLELRPNPRINRIGKQSLDFSWNATHTNTPHTSSTHRTDVLLRVCTENPSS